MMQTYLFHSSNEFRLMILLQTPSNNQRIWNVKRQDFLDVNEFNDREMRLLAVER